MRLQRCAGAVERIFSMCAGVVALAAAADTVSAGIILEAATYRLHNHPASQAGPRSSYGLRLGELFDVTPQRDIFTFDFDHAASNVTLMYDGGSTIHISGVAFGGLDLGVSGVGLGGADLGVSYDPAHFGVAGIDFMYTTVTQAANDDDLIVTTPGFMNTGSITFLGEEIDLFDKANEAGFTFRLGDTSSGEGHRGFAGISGWGGLDHHIPGTNVTASAWLFTLDQTPVPAPPSLVVAGAAVLIISRRSRARH